MEISKIGGISGFGAGGNRVGENRGKMTVWWKLENVSYLRHAIVTSEALRGILKEPIKTQALKREEFTANMQTWSKGVMGKSEKLTKPK